MRAVNPRQPGVTGLGLQRQRRSVALPWQRQTRVVRRGSHANQTVGLKFSAPPAQDLFLNAKYLADQTFQLRALQPDECMFAPVVEQNGQRSLKRVRALRACVRSRPTAARPRRLRRDERRSHPCPSRTNFNVFAVAPGSRTSNRISSSLTRSRKGAVARSTAFNAALL